MQRAGDLVPMWIAQSVESNYHNSLLLYYLIIRLFLRPLFLAEQSLAKSKICTVAHEMISMTHKPDKT